MNLTARMLLLFSSFLPVACAVKPLPKRDEFPLNQSVADTDLSCPKLTGSYSVTPRLLTLSKGHRPRFEGTPSDYRDLFNLREISGLKKSTLLLDPNLEKGDFFIRIIELDDQVLMDSVRDDGSKLDRYDISSAISKACEIDGTRWMPTDDLVVGAEGVIVNHRWITKVAKSANGDLLVYQVIVNAKPTIWRVVPEHYLFRYKLISEVPH